MRFVPFLGNLYDVVVGGIRRGHKQLEELNHRSKGEIGGGRSGRHPRGETTQ